MKTHPLYPLTFRPQYRDALWGGEAIATRYNRANTPRPCSESWEISALPGAESIVTNGPFEGVGLARLTEVFGRDLLGAKARDPGRFPLLVKILDAADRLSVQVHPDAATAQALGGLAKHEMWFVLEASPDTRVWAGVRPGADLTQRSEAPLVAHPVVPGDVLDIPPGLAHAAGPKCLIYEVQTPSDTTFRLHDWGRDRPIQPEAARAALRPDLRAETLHAPRTTRELVPRLTTPDFAFATLRLDRERTLHTTGQSLMILFCASGKTTLEHDGPHPLTLLPGDSVLVPPSQTIYLHPLAPTRLLVTTL